jgi:MFS family permease
VFNASISSALPSGGVAFIADYFHIHNEEQLVLPVSVYLVGYCCGPLAWGPLSETYGRKAVMIPAFCIFTIFTMACALAPTYPALCVFRFFVGIGAACAISIVGGVYADIYNDPVARGRAMSTFMVVSLQLSLYAACVRR